MKRPNSALRRTGEIDMDSAMTPMIDVVFLLLVFFVWTASFQIVEQILPSKLSAKMGAEQSDLQQPPPEMDFEDIVVRIGWNGQNPTWRLNDAQIESLDQLQNRLQAIATAKDDAPVILHPDPIVPLGHVIEVYDTSKLAGFEKVSFAVNPDKLKNKARR